MKSCKPDKDIHVQKIKIDTGHRKIPALILTPRQQEGQRIGQQSESGQRQNRRSGQQSESDTKLEAKQNSEPRTCVLWLHGGGYIAGMKGMVYMSRAVDLVKKFGVMVIAPGYRLAFQAPYPAAIEDCYEALLYIKRNAKQLGIRENQIMVGGESAGGGLCAALCMMARDKGKVKIAYQMPLYPMMDNFDTESSGNNHGRVWNTWKNHFAWRIYLRKNAKKEVSPYAAAARQTNYEGLPPAYTFVGTGEPFYCETMQYIENLRQCGIEAEVTVYESDMHAFDMMDPESELAKQAAEQFNVHFAKALNQYFT